MPSFPLRFVYVACALFASRAVDGSPLFQSTGSVRMFWISLRLVRCWSISFEYISSAILVRRAFCLWFIVSSCHSFEAGGGEKKVCSSFVVARNFFLRWKSLSFWRESNALKKKRSQRYWWIRGTSKYVKCVRMWSKIYVAKYLVVTSLDIQSEFPYVFDKLIVETWCKYIDNFFARFFEVKVS